MPNTTTIRPDLYKVNHGPHNDSDYNQVLAEKLQRTINKASAERRAMNAQMVHNFGEQANSIMARILHEQQEADRKAQRTANIISAAICGVLIVGLVIVGVCTKE